MGKDWVKIAGFGMLGRWAANLIGAVVREVENQTSKKRRRSSHTLKRRLRRSDNKLPSRLVRRIGETTNVRDHIRDILIRELLIRSRHDRCFLHGLTAVLDNVK